MRAVYIVLIILLILIISPVLASVSYLTLECPHSRDRAFPGRVYSIDGRRREIPKNMEFIAPAPLMLTESTLTSQSAHVKHALQFLETHKITYWLTCGSLIGAARHGGFIPWDDDTDVQVPIEFETSLLALSTQIKDAGMSLVKAGGGFKLCQANWLAYPFIDVIFVGKRSPGSSLLELAYPRNPRTQTLTFKKAAQWPKECFRENDIFPLRRVSFEDFAVWIPRNTEKLIGSMYGTDVMTRAAKGNHFLKNHKSLMFVRKLGFVPVYQL